MQTTQDDWDVGYKKVDFLYGTVSVSGRLLDHWDLQKQFDYQGK
jgi:hypothetical protein